MKAELQAGWEDLGSRREVFRLVGPLAWERVSADDLLRQAQLPPQRSHLIFVEIFQRLDYFSLRKEQELKLGVKRWIISAVATRIKGRDFIISCISINPRIVQKPKYHNKKLEMETPLKYG